MSEVMYDFRVSHPDFVAVTVSAQDQIGATVAASECWGVRGEWTKIAGYCSACKLGKTMPYHCKRCAATCEKTTDGLCPDCRRTMVAWNRERAQRCRTDSRARYRR